MQTIWLIRHAESRSNAGEITEAPDSIGLSERGQEQARRLAEWFPRSPDLIVTSPFLRTHETASPVMRRFPIARLEEWPIHEFTFLSPARYRGTTMAERRAPAAAYWERADPQHRDGEGAECFVEFRARVDAFLERLPRCRAPFAAVFTHGYFIKAVIWSLLYRGDATSPEFMRGFLGLHHHLPVDNGAVFPVQIDAQRRLFVGSPWTHPYA